VDKNNKASEGVRSGLIIAGKTSRHEVLILLTKAPEHGVRSVLATKKLGSVGAGRRRQPEAEGINVELLLSDGVPDEGNVEDDVSRHRVLQVLSRDERVSCNLPVIDASRVPNPRLQELVLDGEGDIAVVLAKST